MVKKYNTKRKYEKLRRKMLRTKRNHVFDVQKKRTTVSLYFSAYVLYECAIELAVQRAFEWARMKQGRSIAQISRNENEWSGRKFTHIWNSFYSSAKHIYVIYLFILLGDLSWCRNSDHEGIGNLMNFQKK